MGQSSALDKCACRFNHISLVGTRDIIQDLNGNEENKLEFFRAQGRVREVGRKENSVGMVVVGTERKRRITIFAIVLPLLIHDRHAILKFCFAKIPGRISSIRFAHRC